MSDRERREAIKQRLTYRSKVESLEAENKRLRELLTQAKRHFRLWPTPLDLPLLAEIDAALGEKTG